MLQSVFHFLRIYLFPFLPSPSSTSERIPWYLDNWSSHLIYPLTLSLCPFHSVLYRTAESVNTTVTLLVLKYFNRFPCLQKKVHTLYSKKCTFFSQSTISSHFPRPLLFFCVRACVLSRFSQCPTLWHPLDYSPPGSSVHGILQARMLEWVAISSSVGSSWPRDGTRISHTAGRFFIHWATWEAHLSLY